MNALGRLFGKRPPRLPQNESFFIARVSALALPADSPVRREAPRPVERRGPDYESQFDATSLFYDVFRDGENLVFTGLALRNLAPLVEAAKFTLDGVAVAAPIRTRDIGNVDISKLAAPRSGTRLGFDIGWFSTEVAVSPSHRDVFKDRKVLCAISKNNHLHWISDWIEFHVKSHGADAVLLYDNGSDRYGADELLATIRAVSGITAAVVVPWPYKFGPAGWRQSVDWDSRQAQPVMLEHARRRFLADAAGMVNLDIDELVVAEDGVSLFDRLAASRSGAIGYPGRWIEIRRTGGLWRVRHRYFRHYIDNGKFYLPKWAAVPARLPESVRFGVHELIDFEAPFAVDAVPQIVFRHFRAVGLSWKYNRMNRRRWSRSRHKVDEIWVRAMRRIGWAR